MSYTIKPTSGSTPNPAKGVTPPSLPTKSTRGGVGSKPKPSAGGKEK